MLRAFAIPCAILGAVAAVCAQETIHHASFSGRVTDPSGGVVEGAIVTARQTDTNLASTGATDKEGRFRFPYLKVGPYQVTVRQPTKFIESIGLRTVENVMP